MRPGDRLEAVIFDVDGTLVDSERDGHRVAFNRAFEEAGLPDRWDVATYGKLLRITGGNHRMAHWFERNGMPRTQARELGDRLHPRKTEIMRELIAEGAVRPRPGVTALIDALIARGVAVHVATTGTRAWVDPLLERTFGDRFDTVVTGTEITDLKPSPAAYLEVLRLTGADPAHTAAVEDSSNGVRAAVAAGLTCIASYNSYTRDDDLTGAAVVAPGFDSPALVGWFRQRMPQAVHGA